jgi:2-isopropylmalate synthase
MSGGAGLQVELYDTTLRDGAQGAGVSYSIDDRLRILHKLDQLGVPFVEGGWPGANPRETEFFRLATGETLKHATLTAFGMTRKAGESAGSSTVLRDLLDAGTQVVTLVGKAWDLHVTDALRTTLDEGEAMVRDSIGFLCEQGRRVFFDAEHFFDGYRSDPAFALRILRTAEDAGAERLVLCDTNGGMLPQEVARIVGEVRQRVRPPLGIHVHNDAGCAVANSLIAVEHGAYQVQGVVNGYGERTGNADLIPIAANLVLKMGAECLPDGSLERLTEVAHYVAEVANVAPDSRQPYAGRYAFTHKAGLHASGVERVSRAYEHVEPTTVGNRRGVVASDLGGGATIRMKGREFGVELDGDAVTRLLSELKEREARGYTFEIADASLELLMRRADGWRQPFFEVDSYRVHVEERVGDDEPPLAEATVKVVTKGRRHIESAEGHGPVGALDNALRKALANDYPELEHITLEDFRVRVLDEPSGGSGGSRSERERASGSPPPRGTGAVVRVLIDTSNGRREWTTVGVSENIIEASWEALVDGYLFGLIHPRESEEPGSGPPVR